MIAVGQAVVSNRVRAIQSEFMLEWSRGVVLRSFFSATSRYQREILQRQVRCLVLQWHFSIDL